jgi:hypothetical protein
MRGRLNALLCSCNARSRKTLVGRAQLGIHQARLGWPVSFISRQRTYARSEMNQMNKSDERRTHAALEEALLGLQVVKLVNEPLELGHGMVALV